MERELIYRRLANHYRDAMASGTLLPGDRIPSVRMLMQRHQVSLATALQACRCLESEGWLEARPRAGYFVLPRQSEQRQMALEEPPPGVLPDPAQFVGMHERVSDFVARGRQRPVRINFSSARSAPSQYPGEALRQAAMRALRHQPDVLVKVASAVGNPGFRSVLAKRALASGMVLSPDEVLVTQGCIEALNLALRAVCQPGDIVAVESPTFYGLLQVLETLGLRALEIPTSPQTGLSLDALQLALDQGMPVKALVVVPHLQNPLGAIMPDEHKSRLVDMCRQFDVALIEDDTYTGLLDSDIAPRAIKSWDKAGGVIHCASLHKVLAPGMRLGWMSAGRWQARVEMLKFAQSRYNDELAQMAAGEILASGAFDRHLQNLRRKLRDQRHRTSVAVASYFPAGTRFNRPKGGLALWVELPRSISSQQLFYQALDAGILVAPGLMFSNSNRFDHCVRLNCGAPYTPEIDQALHDLGDLAHGLLRARPSNA